MGDHIGKDYNIPHEQKGYALSGRIMLSAIVILFAVVIIMVCLHVYAQWYILRARRRQIRRARRRTHLVFYIEPDNPSDNAAAQSRGLDAAVLKSLPTFTFGKEEVVEGEVLECAVCLSEFEEKEKGRLLPKCKHCFHVECIDMWFHSHSTCPLCRSPVDAGDVPPLEEETTVGGEVVIELGELTQSVVPELSNDVGPSQGESVVVERATGSSSFGGRRKGLDLVGVSIEVPRRSQSFCFPGSNSDESGPSRSPGSGFKSPTSRIMSLKRILSRDKKSPLPSPSGAMASCYNLDIESGRVESSSQILTPSLTFDDLRAKLLVQESRIKHLRQATNNVVQHQAFAASTSGASSAGSTSSQQQGQRQSGQQGQQQGRGQSNFRGRGGRPPRGRGRGRGRGQSSSTSNSMPNQPTNQPQPIGSGTATRNSSVEGVASSSHIICQICYHPGHSAQTCPSRYASNSTPALVAMPSGESNESVWYPDSGASSHMTNNEGSQYGGGSTSSYQ